MKEIKNVAVIGAGIMGSGIAQVAAQAGYAVIMSDVEEMSIQRGLNAIKQSLKQLKEKKKLSEGEVNDILARIETTLRLEEAAKGADFIVEAVPEDLELKKQVFQDLDRMSPDHTVMGTNTSSLSISAIASATKNPDKVLGVHFANPVPVIELVELIRGADTSEETLETAKSVLRKMGKDFFTARDSPGFAANRLLPLFVNEAFYLLWEGIASAEDIDKVCKKGLRHPMGPLEFADFSGLDTLLSILEYLHKEIDEKYRPCPLIKQLVQAGHCGRKSGRGVYRYDL